MDIDKILTYEITKSVPIESSEFSKVIYFKKNYNNCILEEPDTGTCIELNPRNLSKYLYLTSLNTPWTKLIDNSYIKYDDNHINQFVNINPTMKKIHFSFVKIKNTIPDIKWVITEDEKKVIKLENFSISETNHLVNIKTVLPLPKIWCNISKKDNYDEFFVKKIYVEYNNKFYKFPYGNVNIDDTMCFGRASMNSFKNIEDIYMNLIVTPFNNDYSFNLQSSNHTNSTLDLNYIHEIVTTRTTIYNQLSTIDILYYISQIEEINNFDFSKFFMELPQSPLEL